MEYLFNKETKEKAFLGQGWAFPPQFSKSNGTVCMVQQEEDIWQSLHILFSTSIKERVLQPDYGCNLEDFVFAPMNVTLLSYLEELIKENIALHEPRIKLEKVQIIPDVLEGKIDITLTYLIRSTNTRRNRVYPFYYQEGTNVEL
jgi:phage baseplate assembly protein W